MAVVGPSAGGIDPLVLVDLRDAVPVEVDLHLVDQRHLRVLVDRVGVEFAAAEPQTQRVKLKTWAVKTFSGFTTDPATLYSL